MLLWLLFLLLVFFKSLEPDRCLTLKMDSNVYGSDARQLYWCVCMCVCHITTKALCCCYLLNSNFIIYLIFLQFEQCKTSLF
jgi:hypothetical protein